MRHSVDRALIQICGFQKRAVLPILVLFTPFFTVEFFFLLSHDRQLRSDLFDGGECL